MIARFQNYGKGEKTTMKTEQKKSSISTPNYGIIYPVQKTHHTNSKRIKMEHANCIKKNAQKQHSVDNNFRLHLKGLTDQYMHEHPRAKRNYRFPSSRWAKLLGVNASTVRRELVRGKARHGDEFSGGIHYLYDPEVSKRKHLDNVANTGRKSMLETHKNDVTFKTGFAVLEEKLRRTTSRRRSVITSKTGRRRSMIR